MMPIIYRDERVEEYCLVEAEEEELLEVVVADTVAQPGAMVVHLQHAGLTD